MSPSTSNKSLGGEPTTYEQIEQALFKVANSTENGSGGNRLDAGNRDSENPMSPNVTSTLNMERNISEENTAVISSTDNSTIHREKQPGIPTVSEVPLATSTQPVPSQQIPPSKRLLSEEESSATIEGVIPIIPKRNSEGIKTPGTAAPVASTLPSHTSASSSNILSSNKDSTATKAQERSPNNASVKSKGTARRRGKWTVEEEEYVARVIQDFNSGFLNAPAGYTLRSYLSDKLQCDPMRITKKFTGESCIGKRVFHPAVRTVANAAAIDKAQNELDALERRWRRRLEMQQRESAKKAAASAAAASAASRSAVTVQGVPVSLLGTGSQVAHDSQLQQSAVTQAASWLDRANVILMENIGSGNQTDASFRRSGSNDTNHQQNKRDGSTSTQSSSEDSLEHQMKEVQRLIYEGPLIQQTTAGLPNLLLRNSPSRTGFQTTGNMNTIIQGSSVPGTVGSNHLSSSSAHISPTLEPADKRMKTSSSVVDTNSTGTEDAEALVGFLRSVRASAAAGHEL